MSKYIIGLLIIVAALSVKSQDLKLNEDLSLKYLARVPAGTQQLMPVIILLHGYGSDEKDLFDLRNIFPDKYLIISARAPYSAQGPGYEWFDGKMVNDEYTPNGPQVETSRVTLIKFITEITNKYKANADEVYIMGFSQGAMMSLEVGLTAPAKLKGIGVLSGRLFASLKPLIRKTPELEALKIFIGHGIADSRIKFADAEAARDYLVRVGLKPEFHSYAGMAHQISQVELDDLVKWLKGSP